MTRKIARSETVLPDDELAFRLVQDAKTGLVTVTARVPGAVAAAILKTITRTAADRKRQHTRKRSERLKQRQKAK